MNGSYTDRTIEHELTHYFQRCCDIWLYDSKIQGILENFDLSKIDHIIKHADTDVIKLTLANQLFNNREFLATIDNLRYNLGVLYNAKYSEKMTYEEFLNKFIQTFSTEDNNVFNENQMYNQWMELKLNKKDLDFFILTYILYSGKRNISNCNFVFNRVIKRKFLSISKYK